MTEVPSLVSGSLLTGAEREMGVGERKNNEREMERWERNDAKGLKKTKKKHGDLKRKIPYKRTVTEGYIRKARQK